VKWSEEDPPDAFERARNNLVFRAQLNRNPFIDRPDFAPLVLP
jgi:endonuclease I